MPNFRMKKLLYVVLFALCSCKTKIAVERKQELWDMIKSDDMYQIMEAVEEIRSSGDTSMVDALLYNMGDQRVTTAMKNKGWSVYQLKVRALAEITNITPPKKPTADVDSTIILYYYAQLHRKLPSVK